MRKLKTMDVLAFCRCLKTLGVKDLVRQMAQEVDNAKDVWDMGFDLIWAIFDAATDAKGEACLYDFLAGPFELTPEEVADLDLPDLLHRCETLARENDLLGFFKAAAARTQKIS